MNYYCQHYQSSFHQALWLEFCQVKDASRRSKTMRSTRVDSAHLNSLFTSSSSNIWVFSWFFPLLDSNILSKIDNAWWRHCCKEHRAANISSLMLNTFAQLWRMLSLLKIQAKWKRFGSTHLLYSKEMSLSQPNKSIQTTSTTTNTKSLKNIKLSRKMQNKTKICIYVQISYM